MLQEMHVAQQFPQHQSCNILSNFRTYYTITKKTSLYPSDIVVVIVFIIIIIIISYYIS